MVKENENDWPYWSASSADLLAQLNSRPQGLSAAEAAQRLAEHGPNSLAGKARTSPLLQFLEQFKSPIMLILLAATVISFFVGDTIDAVIILVIVLGSALLSFIQEYNASNATARLQDQIALKTTVLRDGAPVSIPTAEVVSGDVLVLSAGSLIPADGVILSARDLFVNQAVLTGETFPVEKCPDPTPEQAALTERGNVVFMGSNVRSGSANALVVATGAQTAFGRIAGRLNLRPPETEFERGVRRLGDLLTQVMFILVIGIFALNVFFQRAVLDSLLFSIALAVGLTPQLLPAIININLSRGAQKMAEKGVIVRRLSAIENFGSMDVLCTDKTGTLTEGVVQLDQALDPAGALSADVLAAAGLNAGFQTGMSNPLDEAIVAKTGQPPAGEEKIDEIPYDFVRKRLSIVVRGPQGTRLICKGALDNILAVCSQVAAPQGAQPLDPAAQAAIQERFADWSAQGYRVLGLAQRSFEAHPQAFSLADESELTFSGFLLFFDPPKADVLSTIQDLKNLGVELKIITGDNRLVAAHVAESIGLTDARILTGSQINTLQEGGLMAAARQTTVFAEVDPAQKEQIIRALKKGGSVVGYMGDGINDAPSLHAADVGLSVANAVDVARDAADLVLLKQDLDVLHAGILEGRRTFANTLKYVFMATSANFGNMFSMAGASLFLPFLPMLPKQILLLNFLSDLPEMSIAGDQVDAVMIQRAHRWDVAFIRRFMLVFGTLSSVFDYLTFAVLMWVLKADQATFHAGWLIESALSASLIIFALRTRLPFFRSRPSTAMLLTTALVWVVALALPYSPLAGPLGLAPLPPLFLAVTLGIITLYFLSAELVKRWFYRHQAA